MTLQTTIMPNDDYVGSTLTVTHNGEEIFQMNDTHMEPEAQRIVTGKQIGRAHV